MLLLLLYKFLIGIVFPPIIRSFGVNIDFVSAVLLTQTVAFFVPFVVYLLLTKQRVGDVLMFKRLSLKNIILIAVMVYSLSPVAMLLSFISSLFANNYIAEIMQGVAPTVPLWGLLIAIGITPSVMEELMFRGVIYNEYKYINIRNAALVNGLFFGLMHMNLQQFFYAAFLGFIFTYFLYYTKSILAPMLAHFFLNGSQVTLLYLALNHVGQEAAYTYELGEMEAIEAPSPFVTIIVLGVLCLVFIPLFIFAWREFVATNRHNVEKHDEVDVEIIEDDGTILEEKKQPILTMSFWAVIAFYLVYVLVL